MPLSASSTSDGAPRALRDAIAAPGGAALAIWTTTPWTIPANLAVAVNDKLEYALVEAAPPSASADAGDGESERADGGDAAAAWSHRRLVVAAELVGALEAKLGAALSVVATFPGAALEGLTYTHPIYGRESPVVIGGDYITADGGTGLVHTAPGHGQEDYQVGMRYGLPLLSPVDDAGCFTDEAGPLFAGKAVQVCARACARALVFFPAVFEAAKWA